MVGRGKKRHVRSQDRGLANHVPCWDCRDGKTFWDCRSHMEKLAEQMRKGTAADCRWQDGRPAKQVWDGRPAGSRWEKLHLLMARQQTLKVCIPGASLLRLSMTRWKAHSKFHQLHSLTSLLVSLRFDLFLEASCYVSSSSHLHHLLLSQQISTLTALLPIRFLFLYSSILNCSPICFSSPESNCSSLQQLKTLWKIIKLRVNLKSFEVEKEEILAWNRWREWKTCDLNQE